MLTCVYVNSVSSLYQQRLFNSVSRNYVVFSQFFLYLQSLSCRRTCYFSWGLVFFFLNGTSSGEHLCLHSLPPSLLLWPTLSPLHLLLWIVVSLLYRPLLPELYIASHDPINSPQTRPFSVSASSPSDSTPTVSHSVELQIWIQILTGHQRRGRHGS